MKMNTWRQAGTEAKLLLIGIPVFIWTMLPIYHLALFAFSSKDEAMGGSLWPDHPTLHNFEVVFREQHHYLNHFWLQLWNSLFNAVSAGLLPPLFSPPAPAPCQRPHPRRGRSLV